MNKIFISYRRDDTASICGRIYDRLCMRFGRENVFKDVEGIPLGVNFEEYVGSVVAQCAVQLVIIGPGWITASTETGDRRLEDPHDLVRIEVEAALNRNIPVIPVLVQGATIPHSSKLPPSMQGLLGKNGLAVGNDPHFDPDMNLLIVSLEGWLAAPDPSVAGYPGLATWPNATTPPGMGAGSRPSVPLSPNWPTTPTTWQSAATPPAPTVGSPRYDMPAPLSTPLAQGGGVPLAQSNMIVGPPGPVAPPMMPPTSLPFNGPIVPPHPSRRRTIGIIAVASFVIILAIVGVFVLRAVTGTPYTGQWYGTVYLQATLSSGGTVSGNLEVFMDLQQKGDGSISGSGKLCLNANGSPKDFLAFTITGTTKNSDATMSWNSTTTLTVGASLTGNTMTLNESDPSGSVNGTVQKGTESDYTNSCSQLPTPSTT